MVTSVSGSGASGGAAAVAQASAPAPVAAKPAAAQEVKQPTAAQVRLLHAQGESVSQIATKVAITPHAVQSYLGTPAQAPSKSK
ncbi:MAG: hypothetical protein WA658_24035 [Candidatus Acidiferrales bacterium]